MTGRRWTASSVVSRPLPPRGFPAAWTSSSSGPTAPSTTGRGGENLARTHARSLGAVDEPVRKAYHPGPSAAFVSDLGDVDQDVGRYGLRQLVLGTVEQSDVVGRVVAREEGRLREDRSCV